MFAVNNRMLSVLFSELYEVRPNESQLELSKRIQEDTLAFYNKLTSNLEWVVGLDEVTAFSLVGIGMSIGLDKLLSCKKGLDYVKQGSFNLAALELQRLHAPRRFTTILRLGRLS